jgi:hypothetical protein
MVQTHMTRLRLVYPPISNQEAEWVREFEDVEKLMRNSDFYAIAARPELLFSYVDTTTDGKLIITARIEDWFESQIVLSVPTLPNVAPFTDHINIEFGPKLIRIWTGDSPGSEPCLLEWFTAYKLLYDKSHGMPGVDGLDNYPEAMTYDLLYIGIAKVGDSYDRVIKNAHQARQRILSNELQRSPGARVSDEVFLFLFDEASWNIGDSLSAASVPAGYSNKRVVADAEKALVSQLLPPYNRTTFQDYPRGKDGLYGLGFDAYSYFIGEALTFTTSTAAMRGVDPRIAPARAGANVIIVAGDDVTMDRFTE